MIQIMKASAGSGKTFNLAKKYITLLFRKNDSHAYRHILAVTFTNKATDEMKNRILKELHVLATDSAESPYLRWFIPSLFPKESLADIDPDDFVQVITGPRGQIDLSKMPADDALEALQAVAKSILSKILHDYSAFSISTIDKFFQQTLKAFSKEMGQFAAYQVELDKDLLIGESVDRLLDSLSTDKPDKDLLHWLTETAMDQIENGQKYNLEYGLADIAKKLKSEAHRTLIEKTGIDVKELYSQTNLRKMRSLCRKIVTGLIGEVREKAVAVLELLDSLSIVPEDFYRGFMTEVTKYVNLQDNDALIPPKDSFFSRAADKDGWFTKAKSKYLDIVWPALEGPLAEFCNCFNDNNLKLYQTAKLLYGQFYKLGVAGDLAEEFEAVLKERNVLSLDDTNVILKQIIDGSDAPFIYEKTGVRYENFLLDEFQDTSTVQWDNFRPLIAESAANHEDNLVVGDVKQSIYRWRGSDWNLLKEEVNAALGKYDIKETVLGKNFRSYCNIVDFNNRFFSYAAKFLDEKYGEGELISDIYSDVCQTAAAKPENSGSVRVTFCDKEEELDTVVDTIRQLHSRGVPYRDMAVLVRKNESGNEVASALIQASIDVITDDSLRTKSSSVVGRIVALMSSLDNPKDRLNSYMANSLDIRLPEMYDSLPELCEILCRELKSYDSEAFEQQVTYVYSFVDTLLDYVGKNGNDLHGFLKYWEEKSPYISSPATSDAVRIITVHKAKGLDFRYVIFPFAETVGLFRACNAWCMLEDDGSEFGSNCKGIYDVRLSSSSDLTFFDKDYRDELRKQYIDNINTFYVALTRPVAGLHIITKSPVFTKSGDISQRDFNFSTILYQWLTSGDADGFVREDIAGTEQGVSADVAAGAATGSKTMFEYGDFYATACEPSDSDGVADVAMLPAAYDSYPLNPHQESEAASLPAKPRLVFSTDAAEYFSDEEETALTDAPSTAHTARAKGIILHEILSTINTADDIVPAVNSAVLTGLVEEADAPVLINFFRTKISSVESRGWFPDSGAKVLNEAEITDSDGTIHRPDRVIINEDGSVIIIDYKFGAHKPAYLRQISTYADLWRRMGYPNVSAHLWYIPTNEILTA